MKEGLIQDPEACDFNPYRDLPRCGPGGGGDDCFTRDQIDTLNVIFSAKRNSVGEVVYPGWSVRDIGFRSDSADAGDSLVESLGFPQPPSDLAAPQPWRGNPRGVPKGWYWTEQTARYEVYTDRPGFDVRQALGVTFDRGVHGWRGIYVAVSDRAIALLRKMTAASSGAPRERPPVSCERVASSSCTTASATGTSWKRSRGASAFGIYVFSSFALARFEQ